MRAEAPIQASTDLGPIAALNRMQGSPAAISTFTEFMQKAAKNPSRAEIVEIGDNQFQLRSEATHDPEPKQKNSKDQQSSDDPSSDKSSYPNLAQFIIQPVQIKAEAPKVMLQNFIQETVKVIQTLNTGTGKKDYQFTFAEPPLKVNFESMEKKIQIKVTGDSELLSTLEDFRNAHKELQMTLQKIFPEIEIQLAFQEAPAQFSQSQSGNQQQQHSQEQKEDADEDFLA